MSNNRNDSIMIQDEKQLFDKADYNMLSLEDSFSNESSDEMNEEGSEGEG